MIGGSVKFYSYHLSAQVKTIGCKGFQSYQCPSTKGGKRMLQTINRTKGLYRRCPFNKKR